MKDTLLKIGLSPKSIDIYLQLLQKGESSVDELAKSVGLGRTNMYTYLEELKKYNLVEWSPRQFNKALKATDPQNILSVAQAKEEDVKKTTSEVATLLPVLTAMYHVNSPDYFVSRYTGAARCREALEMVYQYKELAGYCGEFVYYGLGEKWYEEHLIKLYKKLKVQDRVVFTPKTPKNFVYSRLKKTNWYDESHAHYRVHPTMVFPDQMDIYILSDSVLTLYSEGEPTCVVIKSQKYRDYEMALFNVIWSNSIDLKKFRLS